MGKSILCEPICYVFYPVFVLWIYHDFVLALLLSRIYQFLLLSLGIKIIFCELGHDLAFGVFNTKS